MFFEHERSQVQTKSSCLKLQVEADVILKLNHYPELPAWNVATVAQLLARVE